MHHAFAKFSAIVIRQKNGSLAAYAHLEHYGNMDKDFFLMGALEPIHGVYRIILASKPI